MSHLEKAQRKECLEKLSQEATTEELLKLVKAMNDPQLRSMLSMI